MAAGLRVGVIGVGKRWRRYRRALAARGAVRVRAVCDPCAVRAERAAGELRCRVAGGVVELVERDDLDAVLVLDPRWQGLWPVEQAIRAGKHVLCASLPRGERGRIAALLSELRAGGPQVVVAPPPRLWRLVMQVWFLLEKRLGPPRLVRLAWTGLANQSHLPALESPVLLPLLLACRELFEAELEVVRTSGLPGAPGHAGLLLGFSEGRVADVSLWRGPASNRTCRIEFVSEWGSGVAELPDDLRWQDTEGRHHRRLLPTSPEAEMLERFARGIQGRTDPGPTLADVHAALGWLEQARQGTGNQERADQPAGGE